jgi:thiol-disulfide isomerase/thioredoxin
LVRGFATAEYVSRAASFGAAVLIARIGIAVALVVAGCLAYVLGNRVWLATRARQTLGLGPFGYHAGKPTILYFTSPGCVPCITIQRPALARLLAAFGSRLQVLEVDATEHPRLADAWGVLSVPTTFIIDAQGRPRGVNHGATRADKLASQLAALGEIPPIPLVATDVAGK